MTKEKKTEWRGILLRLLFSAILIFSFLAGAYLLLRHFGLTDMGREEVQAWVASRGAFAPLFFVLLSFLQVTFIPIPGAVTILAGNYLFGFFLSYLYSFIGMLLGSLFAFFLGRRLGRPFVNWVMGGAEKVDAYLSRLQGRETVVLFFMFLMPFFPDDALCAVAGVLPTVRFPVFFAMQVLTRLTSIGGTLLFMSGEFIPYRGWGIPVLILLGVAAIAAFVVSYRNAARIQAWLGAFLDRHFPRKKEKTE